MHKASLNIYIPSPLSPAKTHRKGQPPLGGQSLLYQTYDDYFNMEEDTSIMTSSSSSPLSTKVPKNDTPATPKGFNEFFFVLSTSSPRDATFTPISPLKNGDIPDALLHLLPQPSNSLLDVVHMAKLSGSLKSPRPGETSAPTRTEPVSHSHVHATSKNTPKRIRPLPPIPILLRNSTAEVPMSLAFTEPSNIPTSSRVEVASIPVSPKPPVSSSFQTQDLKTRHQPDQTRLLDAQSKINVRGPPIPHFASALRYRLRKGERTDVVTPPSWVPLAPSSGHTGRNSPFPTPIQSDSTPSSIPGSQGTPYSYF